MTESGADLESEAEARPVINDGVMDHHHIAIHESPDMGNARQMASINRDAGTYG